jgi:glycosyltransferase involved in cell wall biosynthesis
MMPVFWREILFYSFCLITLIQLFYYVWFFRRVAFFRPRPKQQSQQHPVSVVICARDEAFNLTRNLPGVLVQTYPTTHEVIVVNDNSFDETRYVLEALKKTFKELTIVELTQEAKLIPGKKFPLSIGIKSARHEVVLLTDADCVPATEFWMQKMQDAYDESTDIAIGYGAYQKKPGLLNKLIRYETFSSALQYFSYALAGIPYMGVGRNLSYRKGLFFKHKGFSSHNHIPGGDDDLFVNMAATRTNTRVVIDPDAFTISQAAGSFREWKRQKRRHYSTSKYYKPLHRFLLGLYALSHFLFYPLLAASLLFYTLYWPLAVFGVRFIIQAIVYYKSMKKLQESDLWPWFWLLDIWNFFYYIIFAPALWKKPRPGWK